MASAARTLGPSWGELILYGALAFAGLEVIKGIGEGISNASRNIVEETSDATATGINKVSTAVASGLVRVGEAIAQDYESLTSDTNAQDLLNPVQGAPGGTGTQTGPHLVGNSGTTNVGQSANGNSTSQ